MGHAVFLITRMIRFIRRQKWPQANFNPNEGAYGKFLPPTIGISGGYSSASGQNVTHKNAHLNVKTFKVKTPKTLLLEGANINAIDVHIEANALLMRSLADTQNGKSKSVNAGISFDFSNPTWAGLSGHVDGSTGSYSRAKVSE